MGKGVDHQGFAIVGIRLSAWRIGLRCRLGTLQMPKFAITGSSGRIGRAIHRLVCETGDVASIDRSPSSATTIVADLLDEDALKKGFDGATAVFHVAALHAPHVGLVADREFERINVDGTLKALEIARASGVRTFILTSTTALYGHASQDDHSAVWVTEETDPLPRTIYHRTKLQAEGVARSQAGKNLDVRVIRMSRCFPEPAPVMAAYRLHRGVDARDVASAHVAAADHRGGNFEVFNVSGDTPFHWDDCDALKRDAPEVIRQRMPTLHAEFEARNWPLPRSIDRVYSSGRARRELNWSPRYGYEEVIAQLDRRSPEVLPECATGSNVAE
ncbi:NAD(P)-dependent oxidoreductase [Erythrobacter sp.]|uniref:NAD-dependent epimerase/dehydratase family protein n=1 Tax=Erythrobacter sp. TaxID=1042 RepID=UPI0025C56C24|nr:NAD(P)-dependent oxidoreductase [Erythrobacter sp.]